MPTPSETISTLHTKVVDAAKGYEEAMDIARRDQVGELCAELRRTHLKHAHELAGLLLERGERADADGSFMSTVHKVALNVRFAITADEKSLLPGLRDGEKRIMEAYDRVPAGAVLVIQAVGDLHGAVIGDVLSHRLKKAGVLGIVVDGPVRDVEGMIKYGPGSWSGSISMAGMKTVSVSVETGITINVRGVGVSPGDLVAADSDGVMFHPAGEAVSLLEKAVSFLKAEQTAHEQIAAGSGAAASYRPKT